MEQVELLHRPKDMSRLIMVTVVSAFVVGTACDRASEPIEAHATPTVTTPEADPQENVSLEMVEDRVPMGTTPEMILRNDNTMVVEYGAMYVLERKTSRGWRRVEQPSGSEPVCAFIGIGLTLPPGEATEPHQIRVCDRRRKSRDLKPGLYRVTKSIGVGSSQDRSDVRVEFRVVASRSGND